MKSGISNASERFVQILLQFIQLRMDSFILRSTIKKFYVEEGQWNNYPIKGTKKCYQYDDVEW